MASGVTPGAECVAVLQTMSRITLVRLFEPERCPDMSSSPLARGFCSPFSACDPTPAAAPHIRNLLPLWRITNEKAGWRDFQQTLSEIAKIHLILSEFPKAPNLMFL